MSNTALEIQQPSGIVLAFVQPDPWEENREEREAKIRQLITDWQVYEAGCERRAGEYLALAAKFPSAHRDHQHWLRLANDQLAKAADARRRIKVERECL